MKITKAELVIMIIESVLDRVKEELKETDFDRIMAFQVVQNARTKATKDICTNPVIFDQG